MKKFFKIVSGLIVLNLIVCAIFSHYYWGYVFSQPEVPTLVQQATKIVSYSFVPNVENSMNWSTVKESLRENENAKNESLFYAFDTRPIIVWQKKGLSFEHLTVMNADRALNAMNTMRTLFPVGTGDYYMSSKNLHGVVVEFDTLNEKGLLFVGLSSDQIANDRYVYREAVLRPSGNGYQIIDHVGFFFEVSGFEGIGNFPFLSIFFSILIVLSSSAFALAMHALRKFKRLLLTNKTQSPLAQS